MALAPTISFDIADGDGDIASTSLHVPSGETLTRYSDFAEAFAPILEGVILGEIQPAAHLSIPVDISALTGNTIADTSDVEQLAGFQFAAAGDDPVDLNVPGLNNLELVLGGDVLDDTDTNIAALITMMESGIAVTGGTISPCNIAEADIFDTIYARKITRNSGSAT